MKHIVKKGKKATKKQNVHKLQATHAEESVFDPYATEEEMDVEEQAVNMGDHVAEVHLYDPATPFKCPTEEVLRRAEAFRSKVHH